MSSQDTGPNTSAIWEGSIIERKVTMVREYPDKVVYHRDEQHLGQQGWSLESKVDNFQKKGLVQSILALFAAKKPHFVVTYSRPDRS